MLYPYPALCTPLQFARGLLVVANFFVFDVLGRHSQSPGVPAVLTNQPFMYEPDG